MLLPGSLNQIDQADCGVKEETFEYMMQDRRNSIKISSRTRKTQPHTARCRASSVAPEQESNGSMSVKVSKSAAGGGINLKLVQKAEDLPRQKTSFGHRTKASRLTTSKNSIHINRLRSMNARAIFSGISDIPGCSALQAV